MKIITTFVHPPIPVRSFDWLAHIDGQEEEGPQGWGHNEYAAVTDLQDRFDDGTPASDLLMREFDDFKILLKNKEKASK